MIHASEAYSMVKNKLNDAIDNSEEMKNIHKAILKSCNKGEFYIIAYIRDLLVKNRLKELGYHVIESPAPKMGGKYVVISWRELK